ncbi:MAG: hypothetical protein LBE92_07965 [Chryseobacterium sp.]|uniref:hypothetical protein n=1 Tax=Chryseobacterium sp. TaxID=1871047 RepID=UPI00282A0D5F|nr:hypothetical protein [Chryseobacterium sp.]MDR2236043.1 hypothetical protein [Chryseobacterium sp.]
MTVVSVTCLFAQSTFSVKYLGEASLGSFAPHSIKVEADYNRETFILSSPSPISQITHIVESKYITNGATVDYLLPPTSSASQSFELFHLKVTWTAYQNGYLISRVHTFNDLQISSANSGNEIDLTIVGARIRLKAISSGSHITYQVTLQTY